MNLKYLSCFFLFSGLLMLSSCQEKYITDKKADMKGTWHLNIWTLANNLSIDENTIAVDNHVDTVFRLQYQVSGDTLITWSVPGHTFRNKILLISKDSLILDGFYNIAGTHRYARISTGYQ